MKTIDQIIKENRGEFSDEFVAWISENNHIWVAFLSETSKVINKGFKHYSARTIVHVLRHHSAMQENGSIWKINNNISPYLARLFALMYPEHKDLFEYRRAMKAETDQIMRMYS
jgi:hypothetical protein